MQTRIEESTEFEQKIQNDPFVLLDIIKLKMYGQVREKYKYVQPTVFQQVVQQVFQQVFRKVCQRVFQCYQHITKRIPQIRRTNNPKHIPKVQQHNVFHLLLII